MNFKSRFGKALGMECKTFGKRLIAELGKRKRIMKKALSQALFDMIADTTSIFLTELFQAFVMELMLEPLLKKLCELSKKYNGSLKEFAAA